MIVIAYKEDDIFELPIGIYNNITEAIKKLNLKKSTIYKNHKNINQYKSNGIILEKIKEA